ncbi:hypothetical protein ACTVZO_17780 [Streptomyces sp. IBSNAI002]|uniref:hypothetical protein n=1 Tax=Streptomyces sp. IBSNAI002 TaxID=3457500 RepID=UPI003FD3C503
MTLLPLATIEDLSRRGLAVDPAETYIVETYLEVASAAVRDAAGGPVSQATSTVVLEGEAGQWLRLPGLPVTAVASVEIGGTAVTDWRLRSGMLWRAGGWSSGDGPCEVEVTYTHGLPTVPADIVDLVCRMTAAALAAYRSEPDGMGLAARDVRSERIGDYSVTYGDAGLITEMELPDYLVERLAARFGGGAGVVRSR